MALALEEIEKERMTSKAEKERLNAALKVSLRAMSGLSVSLLEATRNRMHCLIFRKMRKCCKRGKKTITVESKKMRLRMLIGKMYNWD